MNFFVVQNIIASIFAALPTTVLHAPEGLLLTTLVSCAPGQNVSRRCIISRNIVAKWNPKGGVQHVSMLAAPSLGHQLQALATISSRETWAVLKVSTTMRGSHRVGYYLISLVDAVHAHAESLTFPQLVSVPA